MTPEFRPFPKMPRFSRTVTITEKIDGTNGCIWLSEDGEMRVGSRTRWITPDDDNFGFARWAYDHGGELLLLGAGFHYGEWWGRGIQRNYSQPDRHFSLFNTAKWSDPDARPACCGVVPVLYEGPMVVHEVALGVKNALHQLRVNGSVAAPGFMNPEGIVIYHHASNLCFKKTLENDEGWKGQ